MSIINNLMGLTGSGMWRTIGSIDKGIKGESLNLQINPQLGGIKSIETNKTEKPKTEIKTEEPKTEIETEKPKEETDLTIEKKEPTNENIQIDKSNNNIDYEKLLEKLWAREDNIRKETQEREDNAYVRAIRDMKNAGINPNLVGINPANSGGGITNASNVLGTLPQAKSNEINKYTAELNAEVNRYIAELNNMVKEGTATEGNITSVITSLIGAVGGIIGGMVRG